MIYEHIIIMKHNDGHSIRDVHSNFVLGTVLRMNKDLIFRPRSHISLKASHLAEIMIFMQIRYKEENKCVTENA